MLVGDFPGEVDRLVAVSLAGYFADDQFVYRANAAASEQPNEHVLEYYTFATETAREMASVFHLFGG